jgi:membrane protein implicated in regulation of membrane protease activity
MLKSANANLNGGVIAFLSLLGTTPVLSDDVHGFFVVTGAIVSLVAFIWSHIAHKTWWWAFARVAFSSSFAVSFVRKLVSRTRLTSCSFLSHRPAVPARDV